MQTRERELAAPSLARRPSPFAIAVTGSAVLGLLIRLLYIENYPSTNTLGFVGGDGFDYSISANNLADGLGYIDPFNGGPYAHHPPGWVTVLAGISLLGKTAVRDQQRFGALIGILLIVVIALIARRLFGDLTGAVAAALAAVYPGFWVLEAQILAEPLGLLVLGLTIIALYRFAETTDVRRAAIVGVLIGAAALVRSEHLALLVVVVPVMLFRADAVSVSRRLALGTLITAIVVATLTPWAAYNTTRFDEPVLLSTNGGSTLLAGNCSTYGGEWLGFYDTSCNRRLARTWPETDRSVRDRLAREEALSNMGDNLGRLPVTALARVGRTLGVFRPTQTVERVAAWHATSEWPVRAWVASFWFVFAFSAIGLLHAVRAKIPILPIVAPIIVAFGIVLLFYGEPRYHTPADLSFVILAAYGIVVTAHRFAPPIPAKGR